MASLARVLSCGAPEEDGSLLPSVFVVLLLDCAVAVGNTEEVSAEPDSTLTSRLVFMVEEDTVCERMVLC